MGVIAAYRRVLANPFLARLLVGEFVSSIGDWLYLVALLVLVWQQTSDPLILGIIGAARILPYVLFSVPAGILADRYDRRMILIVTDVARGAIMLVIAVAVAFGGPLELVVGLAILATCFSAFFSPAIGSYLPTLVRDESELGPANSAWSSLDNLAFFIGPGIAALLLAIGDVALAFLINAATFGFVALVLWQLPPGRPARAVPADASASAAEQGQGKTGQMTGLRSLARPLAGLGLLNVVDGFVFGGLSVLTVVLAVQLFAVDEATGTGLLNSAIGVGGLVGALIAGTFVLRRRLGLLMMSGAIAFGLGIALMGQVGDFGLALVAMAVASAGALVAEIVAQTLLQRIVPDAIRGRVLGLMQTVTVTAYASGAFIVPIVGALYPQEVLLVCGVAMIAGGIGAAVLLGRAGVTQPVLVPGARLLAEIPMLAALPPASLERAMAAALTRPVSAGEVLIRQGEPADLFYVIVEGEVEVTQRAPDSDEERTLRRMGATEFFGEIGLLSGVPRTATVTAVTDGSLVTLDRDAFLELVAAGTGLTHRLLAMHRGTIAFGEA